MYNTPNYMEQGGEKLVIGGALEVKEGATVTGIGTVPTTGTTGHFLKKTETGAEFAALPIAEAGSSAYGMVKIPPANLNPLNVDEEEGEIYVNMMGNVTAATTTNIVEKFNELLTELKEAKYMEGDMPV